MPTKSFYEPLIIETEEQAELLLRLIEEADRCSKTKDDFDIIAMIEEGERLVDEGFFDAL